MPPVPSECRYALRAIQQRLRHDVVRERVLAAYGQRCALYRLPSIEAAASDKVGIVHFTKRLDKQMPGYDRRHSIAASYVLAFKK
jgi:hypothetical protein